MRETEKKNQFQWVFNLLGGFVGCIGSLAIVGWSIGIKLKWWIIIKRLAYVAIEKKPTTSQHMVLLIKLMVINGSTSMIYIAYLDA